MRKGQFHQDCRRLLLSLTLALASSALAQGQVVSHPPTAHTPASGGAGSIGLRERKNIDAITPGISSADGTELEAYKHAVDLLHHSVDVTNNYQFWADAHDSFTPNHGCEHGNELFFPWHRSLLYYFELALRATDPMGNSGPSTKDVTIPYWDWTVKPSGSRFPTAFEDSSSPLFDNSRITTPVTAPLYDKPTIFGVINSNTTWPGFAGGPLASPFYGAIESPYHNNMHSSYVGGDMSDPSFAALDPIFWSFHAYIDLIWDRWQSIHKIDPTCLDCPLRGLPAEKTAKDLIHVDTQLGYSYTENAGLGARLAMAPAALAVPRALRQVPPTRVFDLSRAPMPGAAAIRTTPGEYAGTGPFTFRLTVPKEEFDRAHLLLVGATVPTTLSYRGTVYLSPSGQAGALADGRRPEFERYAAGELAVWVGHAHAAPVAGAVPHGDRKSIYTDITKALKAAAANAAGRDYELTVVFEVVPIPARRNAPAVRPIAAETEIRFQAARLVLDTRYEASERTLKPVGAAANVMTRDVAATGGRTPYFELHIRPMMRLLDRENMIAVAGLDLWDYNQVKAHADAIITHLNTDMPPVNYGGPWPQEWITLFQRWKDAGFPALGLAQANAPGFTATRSGTTVTIDGSGTLADGNARAWLQPIVQEDQPRSYVLYLEPADPGTPPAPPRGFRVRASFTAAPSLSSITVTDAAGDHVVPIH